MVKLTPSQIQMMENLLNKGKMFEVHIEKGKPTIVVISRKKVTEN